jgi:hypothetical protein
VHAGLTASNAYDNRGSSYYHGAKQGYDAYYNEFWEVDLGSNKNIGSISFTARAGFSGRTNGIRISVWPSKIGWEIPVNPFSTIDQTKTTTDRLVAAKVIDGTIKNYAQCLDSSEIQGYSLAAMLPASDATQGESAARVRICSPYFTNTTWWAGNTNDERLGDYKLNISATNR